ncbi:DUF4167 domain-containing protein [Azospirillum sp. 11R-A]|uniref:DUF4167 domain-containing protein n=1 Tax=Azospirillum sp. 11R-A TaxID=3111634 RepID=UPI003C16735D
MPVGCIRIGFPGRCRQRCPAGGRPLPARLSGIRPSPARVNGSALQKQSQWLARAADAERTGDGVEAELCRQYAEHWFRVSRGED